MPSYSHTTKFDPKPLEDCIFDPSIDINSPKIYQYRKVYFTKNKQIAASRLVYIRRWGSLTSIYHCHHLCFVKGCENDKHLIAILKGEHPTSRMCHGEKAKKWRRGIIKQVNKFREEHNRELSTEEFFELLKVYPQPYRTSK